jgi:hypothetical protein
MKRLVDLLTLDRMDSLIRRQATGSPNNLANRLGISIRSLYELIAFLRDDMQYFATTRKGSFCIVSAKLPFWVVKLFKVDFTFAAIFIINN